MSSPLGSFGPLVAAVVSVGVILAYIVATLLQGVLALAPSDLSGLRELALVALGAVFVLPVGAAAGSSAVAAANRRLDAIGAPTAAEADRAAGNGGA